MDNLPVARDYLFTAAVGMLPDPLARAMRENGLMNPAVLKHYPRLSAQELGLEVQPVELPSEKQEPRPRRITKRWVGAIETTLTTVFMMVFKVWRALAWRVVVLLWRESAVLSNNSAARIQVQSCVTDHATRQTRFLLCPSHTSALRTQSTIHLHLQRHSNFKPVHFHMLLHPHCNPHHPLLA